MDPLSIHTYLSLKHLKPRPQPRDTVKTKIKFCGITVQDHKKHNLSSVEIPMNNDEKNLVDYLYIYGIPELKEEIILLKNGGRKVEMEGLSTKFKYYDTGNGPKSTSREIWLKEFKRYFFDKLSEISKE